MIAIVIQKKYKLLSTLLILISLPLSLTSLEAKDLLIAGTEWCPYNCVEKNRSGIVTEYVERIVKNAGLKPVINLFPWSRAISLVNSKEYDVLMSCGESDSKGLIKSEKLLDYQMCFFTLHSSNWNYEGVESLDSIQLGTIKDYAYNEPLDSYLLKKRANTWIMSGAMPHKRLSKMIDNSRIDAFVEDRILIKYLFGNKYREAGCLQSSPLYLAFHKDVDQDIIDKINSEITRTKGELEKFVIKYTSPN